MVSINEEESNQRLVCSLWLKSSTDTRISTIQSGALMCAGPKFSLFLLQSLITNYGGPHIQTWLPRPSSSFLHTLPDEQK